MKGLIKVTFLLSFLFTAKAGVSQEPGFNDKIDDKAVIGLPGISAAQLTQLQAEFLKYDQVEDAKYIMGTHNCMLIKFDLTKHDFTVYAEFIKVISQFYDTSNCYIKIKAAYAEIMGNIGNDTITEVK